MTIIADLKQRGLISEITHPEKLAGHLHTGCRSCYLGIDPTADSLHAGHLVALRVAQDLQQAGHRIVIVVGSATAVIGDPSGKSQMRNMLPADKIDHNAALIKKQLSKWLDLSDPHKGEVVFNDHWLNKLTYLDFLQSVGKHFSVNRMLAAECYKNRLATGLSFLEFNYMLLQSYDFYHLYQHHDVTVQIGGSDQWSNMLAGVELIRRSLSGEAYVFTTPLLVNSSGQKMGKTEKGALWLDDQKTRPLEFFQYWRNLDDDALPTCFKLLTTLPLSQLAPLEAGSLTASELNALKIQLATELTSMVHGAGEAEKAAKAARGLYSSTSPTIKELAELVDPVILPMAYFNEAQELSICDVLVACKVVASKKEARRLITQGGLEIDQCPCGDPFLMISRQRLLEGIIVKKGKKSYYLIKTS